MEKNEKLYNTISINILKYMNAEHIKIEELSELSGISIKRLKNIIDTNVKTRISIKEIQIISDSLKVEIEELMKNSLPH